MGFVGGVDMEGVGDAGSGYLDGFSVFGCKSAVLEGGGEEVDYGKGKPFFGIEC